MFERFTEQARQVVVLAQDEARLLKHNYIGTEHILLGLIREEEGIAARVLASRAVTLEEVRDDVARIIGLGESGPVGQIPFTPRAKRVLEHALRECISLGHSWIGTEHILLGLSDEGEGVAAKILLDFGVDHEQASTEVLRLLAGPASAVEEEQPVAQELTSPPFSKEFIDELRRLSEEKERAILTQDFEEAARLRDRERRLTRIAGELQRAWERT
jgi:ATP-dependent Clp protease ATP-binding subunit ClpA